MCSCCGKRCTGRYDKKVCRVRDTSVGGWRIFLEFERWRVFCLRCQGVFVERLDWLAENPRYTERFAMHVGALCREMTNKAVAEAERLHDSTVKTLDMVYMRKQLAAAGPPAPRAIGVDEISVRKGHEYRVVVSDLDAGRPLWVGGQGRKESDLDQFFATLTDDVKSGIEFAVMDMWPAFRMSTENNAPNARIIYDKFHILTHLSKALDEVRRSEYRRLAGKDRSYIKGQRYTLLSHQDNLSLEGRASLAKLLKANKRLNTAYVLKESFGQLWNCRTEKEARRFFDNWTASLRWQRLPDYEKFAAMVERHWHGLAAYCEQENKVSLGMVEGINNKIRVIQRKAYGYRDEKYLELKIVASFLPALPRNPRK